MTTDASIAGSVRGPRDGADESYEGAIAEPAKEPHVLGARPLGEARPLDELGSRGESAHEERDLARIGRPIGIEHDDQVAAARGEPGTKRGSLSRTTFVHD